MEAFLRSLSGKLESQQSIARLTKIVIPGAGSDLFVLQALTAAAVASLPLFHLTVKNWTNGWLAFLGVVSLIGLVVTTKNWRKLFSDWRYIAIVLAFTLPIVAVVFSQLLRGEWVWKYLDAPSRFLLAALAFLWLRSQKIDFIRAFRVVCPLSIWFALAFVWIDPEPTRLWGNRFATSIADTNAFGIQIVLLGFLSFMMLQLDPPRSWLLKVLLASSVGVAAYLSVGSQTRTGWIALPFLGFVWLYAMRHQWRKILVTSSTILALLGAIFVSYPPVQHRVVSIYSEFDDWVSGNNTDTSGGVRIDLWRAAIELFKHRPLEGYGDYAQFKDYLDLPAVRAVANDFAIDVIRLGVHNELLANALRSGVLGVLCVLGLYLLPLAVFWQGQKGSTGIYRLANFMGIAVVVSFMVFGITLEVFNLKFSASFYGFLIAVLAAQGMSGSASPTKTC
jgi:O-antigen ligase